MKLLHTDVPCPKCGAAIRQRCAGNIGQRGESHHDRHKLADDVRARLLAMQPQKPRLWPILRRTG